MSDATIAVKPKGDIYEGIAFQFCKVATVALICQRFTLPIAAGLCCLFYVLAFANGKRETRCVLKNPLLVGAFYGLVAAGSIFLLLRR